MPTLKPLPKLKQTWHKSKKIKKRKQTPMQSSPVARNSEQEKVRRKLALLFWKEQ